MTILGSILIEMQLPYTSSAFYDNLGESCCSRAGQSLQHAGAEIPIVCIDGCMLSHLTGCSKFLIVSCRHVGESYQELAFDSAQEVSAYLTNYFVLVQFLRIKEYNNNC
jgi:hypothetical protein